MRITRSCFQFVQIALRDLTDEDLRHFQVFLERGALLSQCTPEKYAALIWNGRSIMSNSVREFSLQKSNDGAEYVMNCYIGVTIATIIQNGRFSA
jgi:hypothetical protein